MASQSDDFSRRLLWHGVFVFLLGLLSGLAMLGGNGIYQNLRLALSSHLVGVTTGMFLLIAGLMWHRLQLTAPMAAAGFWSALYGAYGNWIATFLGAVMGTGSMTAIAATGYQAAPWQESLVATLLATSGTCALAACVIFLWGLRPPRGGN